MVENNYYERKIKYLDLMESGERTGSAGFVKIEVKGMGISLLINVKGLHPTDTYEREVMLQAGESEASIGKISLKEGQGQFHYHMIMDHTQLQGIRIALGGAREICCKWQEKKRTLQAEKKDMQEENIQENKRQEMENVSPGSKAPDAGFKVSDAGSREPGSGFKKFGSGSEVPGPGFEVHNHGSEPVKGEIQGSSQKPREIQVIPWDEVKAVEESLERVEMILSKSEEKDAWSATEKPAGELKRTTRATETAAREPKRATRASEMAVRESVKPARRAEMSVRESEKAARRTEMSVRESEKAARRTEIAARESEKTAKGAEIAARELEKSARGAEMVAREPEKTAKVAERAARPVKHPTSGITLESAKKPVRLMENKWQQIWAIYPHIRPFQDEREYLSISPADFVLLPDEAYRAANNSFLLHGYYNYEHLILARIEKRGEVSYYIGVPGNYYEREKQVAVMFGFESFECGTEPAQSGDFGYYMMRTQL